MTAPIRILLPVAVVLCVGNLLGQAPAAPGAGSDEETPGPQSSTEQDISAAAQPDAYPNRVEYEPALNGSGLFSLQTIQSFHLVAGGGISGGYDTNPDNLANAKKSALYSFSPYVGMMAGSARTQFLLQYSPIFTQYSAYAGNSMQQASARLMSGISPRWSWSFGLMGAHGDNSVRLLAPSHSAAVGGVAGSGSGDASYLSDAGLVTNIEGGAGLHYDASPRDALDFQVADSFNSYPDLHESGSIATEVVNYTHAARPALSLVGYQQLSQYYGDLHCTTIGAGAGFTWHPRDSATMSIRGGPQLDTPSCKNQQGFAYNAYLSTVVRGKSQLYALADRQPVNGFLGPGLWQDDFSAGYQRQISTKNLASVDMGYVQSSTLDHGGTYDGFFADLTYTRQITRPLSFSCRYRNFVGTQEGSRFTRNLVLFSIVLTPESRSLSQ